MVFSASVRGNSSTAFLRKQHCFATKHSLSMLGHDGRYHMRYSLPSRSTAQEDILRTLDQGRSNTAPGSLPGHPGPPRIPLGHPMPNVIYGPAPPGQRLSWCEEHANRPGASQPGSSRPGSSPHMMRGPASRMGVPSEPQRYDPTRGPGPYERHPGPPQTSSLSKDHGHGTILKESTPNEDLLRNWH